MNTHDDSPEPRVPSGEQADNGHPDAAGPESVPPHGGESAGEPAAGGHDHGVSNGGRQTGDAQHVGGEPGAVPDEVPPSGPVLSGPGEPGGAHEPGTPREPGVDEGTGPGAPPQGPHPGSYPGPYPDQMPGPMPGQTPFAGAVPPGRHGSGFFDWIRGLGVRRGRDRWIGGVASGIAERLGIDPVIVRGVFVVLALFFGVGVLAYGIAWALLPEPDGRIHVEEVGHGHWSAGMTGAAVFILLGLSGPGRGNVFGPGGGWFPWPILWVAAVIALIVWALNRDKTRRPNAGPWPDGRRHDGAQPYRPAHPGQGAPATTQSFPAAVNERIDRKLGPEGPLGPRAGHHRDAGSMAPDAAAGPTAPLAHPEYPGDAGPFGPEDQTGSAGQGGHPAAGGYAGGGYPGAGYAGPGYAGPGYAGPGYAGGTGIPGTTVRDRHSHPGAAAVAISTGLAVLVAAAVLLLNTAGLLPLGGYAAATAWAAAAITLGFGIVVAGLRGRGSGVLGFFAVVALVAAAALSVAPHGGSWALARNQSWAPASVSAAQEGFSIAMGRGEVSLMGLAGSAPLAQDVVVPLNLAAADVEVTLPANIPVTVQSQLAAAQVSVNGQRTSAAGVGNSTLSLNQGAPGHSLILQLHGAAGHVNITTSADGGTK